MQITYIITISPIIEIDYLKILVNSLNLQSSKKFNVIFHNQTKLNEQSVLEQIKIPCEFEYRFFSVREDYFFGDYPLWDLYGFHAEMLRDGHLSDYFMSLHMEEFLEPEYTEYLLETIEESNCDIIFGNLSRTKYWLKDVLELGTVGNAASFSALISQFQIDASRKWGLSKRPFFMSRSLARIINNFQKNMALGWKKQLTPNIHGITKLGSYLFEDIFAIKKEFAQKYRWFDAPIDMFFEDIHINFSLENALTEITEFPLYFNKSKVYHLEHKKYYYQIEDAEFAKGLMTFETNNPILMSLKEAISLYRNQDDISAKQALTLSRNNSNNMGTADINYQFHIDNIAKAENSN